MGERQGLANSGLWSVFVWLMGEVWFFALLDSCKKQHTHTQKEKYVKYVIDHMWPSKYKFLLFGPLQKNLPSPGISDGDTNELKVHCIGKAI